MKIQFPIPDTESSTYEYKGNLSKEECIETFVNDFYQNESDMKKVAKAIRQNNTLDTKYNISNIRSEKQNIAFDIDEKVQWIENDAHISNSTNEEITEDYLLQKVEDKEMFILRVDFVYTDMDYDLESELRYWKEDSLLVRNDRRLDSKTKIERLPVRDIRIITEKNVFLLEHCKIVKEEQGNKTPFSWSLLINKAQKIG